MPGEPHQVTRANILTKRLADKTQIARRSDDITSRTRLDGIAQRFGAFIAAATHGETPKNKAPRLFRQGAYPESQYDTVTI